MLVAALDGLRGRTFRALVLVPGVGAWLADRERRVPALLALHGLAAFALALLAPAALLLAGPLLLGVPHLVEDVRLLVVRRSRGAGWRGALLGLCAVLLGARLASAGEPTTFAAVATGVVVAAAAAGARGWRRALLGAAAIALVAAGLGAPAGLRLGLAHLHNLAALGLWLWLFRRRSPRAWLVAAGLVAAAALLASGVLLPVLVAHGRLSSGGLSLLAASDALAPGLRDDRAVGLAVSFAFLQAVHYAVWLTCIPQDDTRAAGPRTLRMAARRLRRDLGAAGAGLAAGLAALVLGAGLIAPVPTLTTYMSLATFHAYLEIAAWAMLVARPS